MAETMNLGPEWMKNSSGANHSSVSVPRTPTTPTVPNSMSFRKFALAEFRYGKEDILALYAENHSLSGEILHSVSLITSDIVKPLAFLPFSEEEQLLFSGCVNSNNSLRLIGRGGGPLRGGRGGRGRGRGRGGSDGGYFHRSYSFDEQSGGGGTGDHYNRSPMDGSSSRGGFEYGRGRGGGGARSGWNNNWRDGSHNSEDERWNSGTNSRWSLSSPGVHHPGRSDSGWRNRDESKKDSLLPEWAQQDTTDGKSTQKDNSGGSAATTEQTAKDKPPVADRVDTKLVPTDKNDKNTSIKRPEKIIESQSDIITKQHPADMATTITSMSSFHTQEAVNRNAEDKPVKSFADVNKKLTPLNPVSNNVQYAERNDSVPLNRNKTNGHHNEEPFSPDGFTQFEKQAEDLLLTEEEETPSSSPITLTGGSVVDSLLTGNPSVVNNTLTFTNSHARLQQPQNNAMQIAPPIVKQVNRPTTLPTPEKQPAIEEFYTWYYQDPDGMIQGPFTSGEMKEWFDAGYFTMDLMVRRACDNHMLPLGQVIQMWKRIPFVTEGKQPPPVKITEPFWKPLMQRQPLLFQQRQQQQQMSLQTHTTTTTSDLTSTAESIWGRGAVQEKATPSTQWPNIESVWEQSHSSSQEDYARHEEEARRLEQEKQRQEHERQKKLEEEQRRKDEEAQRRLEEEVRLKQQQEMEAKTLREAKERQERERIRLLEEEKRRKEEEAELERERQRQLEQERLAEWKRNEEAMKFQQQQQQQQQEEERRLREQQLASMDAIHEQQRSGHPQGIQQQQVWSVMGPQSTSIAQPTGGASLLQIQQQEEARLRKQQMIREQHIRAQMAAAQQAQASAGWMTSKGGTLTWFCGTTELVLCRKTRTIDSIILQQACCHGLLYRKVEKEAGRRSHDRSWKCFYSVLKDNHLFFYKDRSDVDQNKKLPDENPIDVASALADIAHSYTKRKHVFRLTTQSGLEMLLQTEDQASLMKWVKAVQTCNEEGHVQKGGRDARTALIIKKKDKQMKAPSSPPPVRKASMPSPTNGRRKNVSTGKTPGEGGGRLPLFELIKNSLRLHRSRNSSDEPDSSSYTTFGVDLDLCPASIENKLVPLVVEFCVHHIEDNGLDVEGLYRVPGTRGIVNKLITELNKGNYHHDFSQWGDVHNYTSLLKAFFNELPDAIIPSNMYHQFVAAAKEHDFNRLYSIKQLIYRLPAGNKHTLKFLLAHLRTVHQHASVNKMSMKNLCIVFGPTLMRCPVHEVGPSYVIMELFLKNMDSFFEDVDLSRESLDSTGNDMGRLLPKQLNADKQLNVDQRMSRSNTSQSDVKLLSSAEGNSAVGSIWKRNSPRNPQIHKSPSRSGDEMSNVLLVDTPETIPEGRVVNIDEAIACRNSTHQDFITSNLDDVTVRHSNGKLDRHGDSNRNHRLLGDALLPDHLGVAIDSSSSSLGTASSEEHMFKNYLDGSWDQSRHKSLSSHGPPTNGSLDVTNETRAHSVTSPYSTHLESDL